MASRKGLMRTCAHVSGSVEVSTTEVVCGEGESLNRHSMLESLSSALLSDQGRRGVTDSPRSPSLRVWSWTPLDELSEGRGGRKARTATTTEVAFSVWYRGPLLDIILYWSSFSPFVTNATTPCNLLYHDQQANVNTAILDATTWRSYLAPWCWLGRLPARNL